MSDHGRSGTCLCGSVRIHATLAGNGFAVCHCDMCQTWGGGPMFATHGGTDVRIDGGEIVGIYRSSDWAERGFCTRCGTHLFYRLVATGEYELPVGLLGGADWAFETQIFIDEKPPYYTFADDTDELTGAEVFERYGGGTG